MWTLEHVEHRDSSMLKNCTSITSIDPMLTLLHHLKSWQMVFAGVLWKGWQGCFERKPWRHVCFLGNHGFRLRAQKYFALRNSNSETESGKEIICWYCWLLWGSLRLIPSELFHDTHSFYAFSISISSLFCLDLERVHSWRWLQYVSILSCFSSFRQGVERWLVERRMALWLGQGGIACHHHGSVATWTREK